MIKKCEIRVTGHVESGLNLSKAEIRVKMQGLTVRLPNLGTYNLNFGYGLGQGQSYNFELECGLGLTYFRYIFPRCRD